jgi:hypothetical protein
MLFVYIGQTCIEEYTGGINMYDTCTRKINHAIALLGWGTEVMSAKNSSGVEFAHSNHGYFV